MAIHLGRGSPRASRCLPGDPAKDHGGPRPLVPLSDIAPGGACRAGSVASPAVGSYPTVSPLPCKQGGLFSVALSLGLPPPGVTRHRVSVEPGLSSPSDDEAAIQPSALLEVVEPPCPVNR